MEETQEVAMLVWLRARSDTSGPNGGDLLAPQVWLGVESFSSHAPGPFRLDTPDRQSSQLEALADDKAETGHARRWGPVFVFFLFSCHVETN